MPAKFPVQLEEEKEHDESRRTSTAHHYDALGGDQSQSGTWAALARPLGILHMDGRGGVSWVGGGGILQEKEDDVL